MINKTDAPDGYEAASVEKPAECYGCHFYDTGEASPIYCGTCIASDRADNEDVIFKLIRSAP